MGVAGSVSLSVRQSVCLSVCQSINQFTLHNVVSESEVHMSNISCYESLLGYIARSDAEMDCNTQHPASITISADKIFHKQNERSFTSQNGKIEIILCIDTSTCKINCESNLNLHLEQQLGHNDYSHDNSNHSKAYITIAIRLRYDNDMTIPQHIRL